MLLLNLMEFQFRALLRLVNLLRGACESVTAKDVLFCTSFIDHTAGETCFSITQKFNLTMDEFSDFNPNLNCDKLFVGEWLCLLADIGH
ncbi:hypothetical protein DCAR_0624006 [Daucus carota subsp. sativus]|uniref:LysM domain-containing protein n=1 Tax=Daucus carota subsp. sativus TaxID=79200 RepID=A0AAF1B3A1_DAUCS|nr:hypothetical protein DCAR_0624006 [Daucus carota subsp. sativus]